ncbi:MAG: hypothetical protein ACRDRT_01170, partial [Pseudonocardiaceae bacterium]
MLAAAVVLATVLVGPARAIDYPGDRLVNHGAEEGLSGWQAMGFRVADYDADAIPRHPAPWTLPSQLDAGARLFFADADAAIWQVVNLSDLAETIDASAQPLSFGALLGGLAEQQGGARLLVQPLDAVGAAVVPPLIVGPPSQRDRAGQTGLLNCAASTTAPVGTRAVLVRVETIGGGGLADNAYLLPQRLSEPASTPLRPSDGPGCRTEGPIPGPQLDLAAGAGSSRPPRLRLLVTMPASNRCGRSGPLRFRIQRTWRAKVSRFQVTA